MCVIPPGEPLVLSANGSDLRVSAGGSIHANNAELGWKGKGERRRDKNGEKGGGGKLCVLSVLLATSALHYKYPPSLFWMGEPWCITWRTLNMDKVSNATVVSMLLPQSTQQAGTALSGSSGK